MSNLNLGNYGSDHNRSLQEIQKMCRRAGIRINKEEGFNSPLTKVEYTMLDFCFDSGWRRFADDPEIKQAAKKRLQRRTIRKAVAGVALAALIAYGSYTYVVPAITQNQQHNYTQIEYNQDKYNLKDLFLLTNENKTILVREDIISSSSRIKITHMPGGGLMPRSSRREEKGFFSLSTGELIDETDYEVTPIKDLISFEYAQGRDFTITQAELSSFIPELITYQR